MSEAPDLTLFDTPPFYPPKPRDGMRVGNKVWEKLADSEWVAEIKLDGIRCITVVDGRIPRFFSHSGRRLRSEVPESTRLLSSFLPHGEYDGELYQGSLWMFDMPSIGARLEVRRHALESALLSLLAVSESPLDGLCLMPRASTHPFRAWRLVESMGAEGIVFKDPNAYYPRNGSPDARATTSWVKFKKPPLKMSNWRSHAV